MKTWGINPASGQGMHRIAIASLLMNLCVPAAVRAQTNPDLEEAARRHRAVYVTDPDGYETAGRIERADAYSITIATADGDRFFNLRDGVQSVYRRGDSIKSGLKIGAVSGAVFGALTALNVSCGPLLGPPQRCTLAESSVITGFMTGVGAGIGIGIDALVHGRTRLYPSFSRGGAGAWISAGW